MKSICTVVTAAAVLAASAALAAVTPASGQFNLERSPALGFELPGDPAVAGGLETSLSFAGDLGVLARSTQSGSSLDITRDGGTATLAAMTLAFADTRVFLEGYDDAPLDDAVSAAAWSYTGRVSSFRFDLTQSVTAALNDDDFALVSDVPVRVRMTVAYSMGFELFRDGVGWVDVLDALAVEREGVIEVDTEVSFSSLGFAASQTGEVQAWGDADLYAGGVDGSPLGWFLPEGLTWFVSFGDRDAVFPDRFWTFGTVPGPGAAVCLASGAVCVARRRR